MVLGIVWLPCGDSPRELQHGYHSPGGVCERLAPAGGPARVNIRSPRNRPPHPGGGYRTQHKRSDSYLTTCLLAGSPKQIPDRPWRSIGKSRVLSHAPIA